MQKKPFSFMQESFEVGNFVKKYVKELCEEKEYIYHIYMFKQQVNDLR